MLHIVGQRCAKCFAVFDYPNAGVFCAHCHRPIHYECKDSAAAESGAGRCSECGVTMHCDLCEQDKQDAMPGFLRLQRTSAGIGSVSSQWVNLQCRCCNECFRKGSRVRWSGIYGLALMFGIPIVLCGGGGTLVGSLFREDGVLPGGLLGIPGKQLINGFLLVATILSFLGFIFALPLSGMLARRRMKEVFKPHLDEQLRKIAGVTGWGAFANVSVFRTIPDREPIVPLNQLAGK